MADNEAAQEPVANGVSRVKPPALPSASPQEVPVESAHEFNNRGVVSRAKDWVFEEGPWWLCSFVFHLVLICSLALVGGKVLDTMASDAPSFEEAKVDPKPDVPETIERFEVGETPEDPSELNTDTLTLERPAQIAQDAEFNDDSAIFEHKGGGVASDSKQPDTGGLGGFDIKGIGAGPIVKGKGGVGVGIGTGTHPGSGGSGWGFGGRGSGSRKALLGSGGGTIQSERAVLAALNWLARHQSSNGSWSLTEYKARCKDATCTCPGKAGDRPSAATAMALLPFLAAGQTHESKGPYKRTIASGVQFLIANQKPNGDLRMGGHMYDHGLAAIALCECYGMSNEKNVRVAAQASLNFIMEAQDPDGGGWRYEPRQAGDTSVVGWQIMALKSGQMAYLNTNPATFEKAKAFLKSVNSGGYGGRFTYLPGGMLASGDQATTAIALLCHQYMGMPKTDPTMIAGTSYLMQNLPDPAGTRNIYYWYYATQVLHNQPGPDWDNWNRKMRRLLIDTQCKDGCATGSWAPDAPTKDQYGDSGGRLMMTSLSALTLEVYYRYLPLYKLDRESGEAHPPGAPAPKTEGKSGK